ncbi:cytochrome P450 [Apiosordaria backusii]|uniref:Cytochrome P450 n=1 Tax=Apiosordaria backusii TaxID=314023 RepID=A0AA40DHU8_9PEZI|nr:cytochrome P450 [Apiosordaria backusii]
MGLLLGSAHYLLAAVVFALLVRAVTGKKAIRRNGEPLRNPPNTLPLVGNGIQFLQPRWNLLSWFDRCQRQFGYETLALTVPTLPPGVLIHDPQNLDYVFKHEGLFTKGNFVKTRSWDLFGNGIINADGDFWKLQRKAGLSFLNTANLRVLTDVALPQYLSESVKELQSTKPNQVVDLQDIFHEITTKLMGKMAYNMEMHFSSPFSSSFDHASGCTAQRFQNPLYPLTELFFGRKFRKSVSIVKKFGLEIVSRAMEDQKAFQDEDGSKTTSFSSSSSASDKLDQISGSLIQSLLSAIPDSPSTVADAALTYLSAGRDTTGQALTWTFYLLLSHPEVLSKIRSEVDSVLSQQQQPLSSEDLPPRPGCCPSHLPSSPQSQCPTPSQSFTKPYDSTPQSPLKSAKPKQNSVLVWCLWAMQRSKLTWGKDADEFNPGRFLDSETGRLAHKSAAEFPVFYGGARTCLGRRMAEGIAVQVIPAVAYLFDFERGWGKGERRSGSSLTLPMGGGCLFL